MNNKKRYNPQFKIGDLVTFVPYEGEETTGPNGRGIVLETGYDMWGEEGDSPTGVKVLWQDTMEMEYVYNDELKLVAEVKDVGGQ